MEQYIDKKFEKYDNADIRAYIRSAIMGAIVDEELGIERTEKIAEHIMDNLFETENAQLSRIIEYSQRLRGDRPPIDWHLKMFEFLGTLIKGDTLPDLATPIVIDILEVCEETIRDLEDEDLNELLNKFKEKFGV